MTNSPTPLPDLLAEIAALQAEMPHSAETITLLAVSKTRTADEIAVLADQGQRNFGENYLQEALEKIDALQDRDLIWHYIGRIQSNKTRPIAEQFDWVHTVDRLKIAQRLNDQRPETLPPLNLCLQVNTSGETSKGGIALSELPTLAEQILALPRLRLRGLMTLPAPESDFTKQRQPFHALAQALADLRAHLHTHNTELATLLDTLSMGTSSDYRAAVAEGANLIRIGTALFGPRAT